MSLPPTDQFRQLKAPSGKKAFEAYCAIYVNRGTHVCIAAPTLATLEVIWLQVTGVELILGKAQHVYIVSAEGKI